ncbi:hypothetical protein EW146_g5327 [Bondarzewia mesenterica]|uniref:Peptidase M20 dimerisation domain-containing protein n=1 Tax=Bondarzewia mesenterica TaxID=1095465 RepID=A0A4S4LSF8_9AGAM|nr:hypothetical protein EW146_g5327 [Bondarzewia mesenterica]
MYIHHAIFDPKSHQQRHGRGRDDPRRVPCAALKKKTIQIKFYAQTVGELETTRFMVDQMPSIDLDSAVHHPFDNGAHQNAVGRRKGTSLFTSKSLLFVGHVDTNNFVSERWKAIPWEGKFDVDFIYDIGVSNMKPGCAAYFSAMKKLRDAGGTPKGDVVLTYVVGELQDGVGSVAAIEQGQMSADYFINWGRSDIRAITVHAESLAFEIELTGITRHMSARKEAIEAIRAASSLIPHLTALTLSNARSLTHEKVNRYHIGVVHGALCNELAEWRPLPVLDYCRLRGSARYAPGQTQAGILTDLRQAIEDMIRGKFPGLQYEIKAVDEPTIPSRACQVAQ